MTYDCHPITNWPRSLPPTIVPIGALHTRPAEPLSQVRYSFHFFLKMYVLKSLSHKQGLKEFADEAKEGLVIFTLGSFVPVSSMPKEVVDTFIRVFSKLPQRVVWKWEVEIPQNIPANIQMVKWLPQQDLLGKLITI